MNQIKDYDGQFCGANLVAVSSTMYSDPKDPRFELALENAENWHNSNIPYVVIDASPVADSGAWVVDAHRHRGAIVMPAIIAGVATQRIQAVEYGLKNGAKKMISHEPEKVRMYEYSNEISNELDNSDIVVIGRGEAALDTLPPTQRRTEKLASWILERTHGLPADSLSGGRAFGQMGAEALMAYPAGRPGFNNWIYLYDTPLHARAEGLKVSGLTVDLTHPHSMYLQEEGNTFFDRKRYDQFTLQLDYLLRRSDIDPSQLSVSIAGAALDAINLMKNSDNSEFELELNHLELELAKFGYSG